VTRAALPARRDAGFTLTELMAVVAVISVLGGLAVVAIKDDPVKEASRKVATLVQEARRVAVAGGPTGVAETARASIFVDDLGGSQYRVSLYRYDEATLTWAYLHSVTFRPGIEVSASSNVDFTLDGNRLAPILAYPTQRKFYPSGSAESMTLYVRRADDRGDHVRIAVYPTSGIPETFLEW